MYNKIIISILIVVSIVFLFVVSKKEGIQTKKEGLQNKKPKNYLEGIDVIYWINLDRSTDRRQRMETMFKDPVFAGKKIIRVQAVDGKASNIDDILNANFKGMQPERFTKLDYACTLSHINAIRQFSQSDDKVALIMEDDMTLEYKPYWKRSVKHIMKNAPSDWEIIQLCINVKKPLKKLYTYNNGTQQIYCNGAYIIKKNINNALTNGTIYFNNNLHGADEFIYNSAKTYAYKYPLFTYSFKQQSTIHQDHVDRHDISKRIMDNFVKNN